MEWKKTIKAYQAYLMLEKGLANNTVEAYTRDIQKLADYCQRQIPPVAPEQVDQELLLRFRWWDLEPQRLTEILPLLCDSDLDRVKHTLQEELA